MDIEEFASKLQRNTTNPITDGSSIQIVTISTQTFQIFVEFYQQRLLAMKSDKATMIHLHRENVLEFEIAKAVTNSGRNQRDTRKKTRKKVESKRTKTTRRSSSIKLQSLIRFLLFFSIASSLLRSSISLRVSFCFQTTPIEFSMRFSELCSKSEEEKGERRRIWIKPRRRYRWWPSDRGMKPVNREASKLWRIGLQLAL